jgi:putative FmdB family regulatory protein
MPIYEYECTDCEETFSKLVRMSSTDAIECPNCGSVNVAKQFSTFASRSSGGGKSRSGGGSDGAACSTGGG